MTSLRDAILYSSYLFRNPKFIAPLRISLSCTEVYMKQLCVLTLGLTCVVVLALFITTTFSVCHLIELIRINISQLETVDKMDELAEGYLTVYSSMLSVALLFLGIIGSLLLKYFIKDDDASSRHYVWIKRIVFVTNIVLVYAVTVLAITMAFFMIIS